jgi:hypothetical protein
MRTCLHSLNREQVALRTRRLKILDQVLGSYAFFSTVDYRSIPPICP